MPRKTCSCRRGGSSEAVSPRVIIMLCCLSRSLAAYTMCADIHVKQNKRVYGTTPYMVKEHHVQNMYTLVVSSPNMAISVTTPWPPGCSPARAPSAVGGGRQPRPRRRSRSPPAPSPASSLPHHRPHSPSASAAGSC